MIVLHDFLKTITHTSKFIQSKNNRKMENQIAFDILHHLEVWAKISALSEIRVYLIYKKNKYGNIHK